MQGLPIARLLREDIARRIREGGLAPVLNVLLVGDDPASEVYAASKIKVAEPLGIKVNLTILGAGSGPDEILAVLSNWNDDPDVHGILVEMPLPGHLDKNLVLAAINPNKDVDGAHPLNRGYLLDGLEERALVPATPLACVTLLQHYNIPLKGKRVTLVGRGETVGRPLASMLIKRDATVTVCHSKTVDLALHCRQAEILIVAAGAPKLVSADMVTPGAVVLDAGINPAGEGICGDVDPAVARVAAYLSPVPGGVGSLTTTIIMATTQRVAARGKAP